MTFKQVALAPVDGLKRLTRLVFRQYPSRIFTYARSQFDWAGAVGDGTGSSTVMAPLLWIARTFPEAPVALWQQLENGQEDLVRDHPMLRLLQRPNRFYTGPILWMATITDWSVDGNAYWLKLRNKAGVPAELWWAPQWMIKPVGSEREFITHYEYRPGTGDVIDIDKEDVIHFRFGMDADDPRLGYSPLKSVLREVYTDDEAAAFTASLLKNMGVPGLVVSPQSGVTITDEQAKETKAYLLDKFAGDRRGEPLVMTGATDIHQFGFSPEQLLLRELRRIPEERVTAVLGVPAIVAGLGAGLDRSTFTNMSEAREMAYESNIIPTQRIIAEDLKFQLLNEFVSAEALWGWRFGFDLAKVRVLQEDLYRQAQRLDLGVRGGWVQVGEARRHLGLEVLETDAVYLRQLNVQQVNGDGSDPPLPPQPALEPGPAPEQLMLAHMDAADMERKEQIADLKALISEWRPPQINLPAPVTNFHAGAFAAAPAPSVTVEAPPPAQVTVPVTVEQPPAVVAKKNGKRNVKFSDGRTATIEDE